MAPKDDVCQLSGHDQRVFTYVLTLNDSSEQGSRFMASVVVMRCPDTPLAYTVKKNNKKIWYNFLRICSAHPFSEFWVDKSFISSVYLKSKSLLSLLFSLVFFLQFYHKFVMKGETMNLLIFYYLWPSFILCLYSNCMR